MLALHHYGNSREDHEKCDTKSENSPRRRGSRQGYGLRDRSLHLIGKILIDETIEVFGTVRREDLCQGI